MQIVAKERTTKKQAKEITNVVMQAAKLLKNPEAKPMDFFNYCIFGMIFAVVAGIVFAVLIAVGRGTALTYIGLSVMAILLVTSIIVYRTVSRFRNTLLNKDKNVLIVIDEEGIDYNDHEKLKMKTPWTGISFIREFDECLYFFPTDMTGLVICVNRKETEGVSTCLKELGIGTRMIRKK
ncbi:MAG: hypothetical protein K5927_10265 [Lachnospiraceae bacterium]|nr:hypothetical protein [Lachnospiraceae bacterium]